MPHKLLTGAVREVRRVNLVNLTFRTAFEDRNRIHRDLLSVHSKIILMCLVIHFVWSSVAKPWLRKWQVSLDQASAGLMVLKTFFHASTVPCGS